MKKCKVCGKDLEGEKCIKVISGYYCHYDDDECFQKWSKINDDIQIRKVKK